METWEEYLKRMKFDVRPFNWPKEEWERFLAWEKRKWEAAQKRAAQPIRIRLRPARTKETYWTRYRAKILKAIGFTDYEISELKYNRLSLPRVQFLLRDVRREVRRIQRKYGLRSYQEAAEYRRQHFVELVDSEDITETDPYIRMGYRWA